MYSKWDMLEHINRCRLYLNAFYISDLSEDGVNVNKGFLDGSEIRRSKQLNIPDLRKPTTAQWRVWESFIFRNFLSPGRAINPPLGDSDPLSPRLKKKLTETEKIQNLYGTEGSLEEILQSFPDELQAMIGEVRLLEDGGQILCDSIVEGECLAASNGSLRQEFHGTKGGFGYVLCHQNSDTGSVEGIGISPDTDEMSSQTTEHQGLIGVLCLLHALCIKYLLCKEECWGKVTIFIDKKVIFIT